MDYHSPQIVRGRVQSHRSGQTVQHHKERVGTERRYRHLCGYVDENNPQSVNPKVPKSQFDTLDCTLEELAILELIAKNPTVKQQELVEATGKSLSTVKRIMKSLQDKNYIRRESGKRYGKWEVLV